MRLRQLRADAGLTRPEVAGPLGWSQSKLLRIEAGQVGVSLTDLRALLELYGAEPGEAAALCQIARTSRRQPYGQYRDVLPAEQLAFLRHETAATRLRGFDLRIPEFVQTAGVGHPPPQLWFILDEAALRRPPAAGCRRVLDEQLQHLRTLAHQPHIRLQVLPASAGYLDGMSGSGFTLLDLPGQQLLVHAGSGLRDQPRAAGPPPARVHRTGRRRRAPDRRGRPTGEPASSTCVPADRGADVDRDMTMVRTPDSCPAARPHRPPPASRQQPHHPGGGGAPPPPDTTQHCGPEHMLGRGGRDDAPERGRPARDVGRRATLLCGGRTRLRAGPRGVPCVAAHRLTLPWSRRA